MNPSIATIVYTLGICLLFWLDRDHDARTSKALWIPVVWLFINGSRPVSVWLQMRSTMELNDLYRDGSPLDALVWGTLLLAGLVVLARRVPRVGTLLRANLPIILFFLYCALSILWSDYPFIAFKRWVKALGDVTMILIVLTDENSVFAVRRFLTRAGFWLVPLSVLFIKYYPDLGRSYNPWKWTPMFSGVTLGKNLLGMTCLICGLGSLWCFLAAYRSPKGKQRTRHLVAHGVILAMVIWLFWMANSMTSLSCFLIASAVMVLTSRRQAIPKPVFVHLLVTSVILVVVFALFLDSGGSIVRSLGRDSTLTGRTQVWAAVLSVARNPLLGTGFESFWLGKRLEKVWEFIGPGSKGLQEAHNGYLEVYLNLGWIGLTFLGVMIVTGYPKIVAAFRHSPELASLSLAYFIVGIIYNLTEAGFRMMDLIWISFLLAIIGSSGARASLDSSIVSMVPETESESELEELLTIRSVSS